MVKRLGPSHHRKLSPSLVFGVRGGLVGAMRSSSGARTAATRWGGSKGISTLLFLFPPPSRWLLQSETRGQELR